MLSNFFKCLNIIPTETRSIYTGPILQRARMVTKKKKDAKKRARKVVEVKPEIYIPRKILLAKEKMGKVTPRKDDSDRSYPVDDVYNRRYFRWPVFSVQEAIAMHRETQHPTMFNMPNADVVASVELSMAADKKNQFIEEFSNVLLLPHQFEVKHNRTIMAICKDEEMINSLKEMEVTLAVGPEAVKMLEKGTLDIKIYEHIICHTSLLPELINIRGILRKKFPSPRNGTAGTDLPALANKFLKGVKYDVVKDKYDHDFGKIDIKIGTLEMDHQHTEENLKILLNDVENKKPSTRSKRAITLVNLKCANSREVCKIDHAQLLPPVEEEEENVKAKAKAS